MLITIDPKNKKPMYLQIKEQIIARIKSGAIVKGFRLPSTRSLAEEIGISRRTVNQAFAELIGEHWLEARVGQGTFVNGRQLTTEESTKYKIEANVGVSPLSSIEWSQYIFPMEFFGSPQMPPVPGQPSIISFTKATPDPELFPLAKIKKIIGRLLWSPDAGIFNYSDPQGLPELVDTLEEKAAQYGVDMSRNDIIVTDGFQQALNLVTELLVHHGDVVLVENPTYQAIANIIQAKRMKAIPVPMDEDGMKVDAVERLLVKNDVKLIIVTPTFHNPTGYVMSLERRKKLLELAAYHQVPIFEDNCLSDLRYDGIVVPSLKALDNANVVISASSFSKTLVPGIRIGFIILPREVSLTLLRLKRATEKGGNYLMQKAITEFINKGYYKQHLSLIKRNYRDRRDVLLFAMSHFFPKHIKYTRPLGGLSVWVYLPEQVNSMRLYQFARAAGVDFAVGNYFDVFKQECGGFRLSFSCLKESQIEEGVKRLADVVKKLC